MLRKYVTLERIRARDPFLKNINMWKSFKVWVSVCRGRGWHGGGMYLRRSLECFSSSIYTYSCSVCLPPLKVLEDREHILLIFLVPHCIGILWLCYDAGMWVTLWLPWVSACGKTLSFKSGIICIHIMFLNLIQNFLCSGIG